MNEIGDYNGINSVRLGGRDGSPVVFAQLDREWTAMAADMSSFSSLRAWAVAVPALDGFASLAELVATVSRMGDPDRSCRLLADLLVIADGDELATRAVLQAVVPGLRQATRRRWRQQTAGGPWGSADDLAAEAVSAGWATIRLHAGRRHDRPAAVIVRAVEGRLRRTHAAWRKEAARSAALLPGRVEPSQSGQDAARSVEGQAAAIITGAVRAGALDRTEARLVFATGVLGCSVADAARIMGLEGAWVYRSLTRARETLRAWLRDTADGDTANVLVGRWGRSPHRSALFPCCVRGCRHLTELGFRPLRVIGGRIHAAVVAHAVGGGPAARDQPLQGVCPDEDGRDRLGDHRRMPEDPSRRPGRLRRAASTRHHEDGRHGS